MILILIAKDLNKDYFLSIGRLTKQKNHKLLIDLFFHLKKAGKNFYSIYFG